MLIRTITEKLLEEYLEFCSKVTYECNDNYHCYDRSGYDPISKICYLGTPKCASTNTLQIFINLKEASIFDNRELFFEKIKKLIFENYNFFIIIRDPIKKYISALTMNYFESKPEIEYIEQELCLNHFIFDNLTAPQSFYIDLYNIPKNQLIYLKLDNNLNDNINRLMKIECEDIVINNSFEVFKTYYKDENEKEFKDKKELIENLVNKYCLNNPKFYELYRRDFKLYFKI